MRVKIKDGSRTPAGLSSLRAYDVLSLALYKDGRVDVRLLSDGDGLPALYALSELEIVNGDIPEGWCVIKQPTGTIELLPKEWAHPEFWTRFFDGERDAEQAFELYLQKSRG